MVTGTVIRPVRGAGLVSALLPLHMPFKDAPALIRANPRSLGVPARFAPQFAADPVIETNDFPQPHLMPPGPRALPATSPPAHPPAQDEGVAETTVTQEMESV